MSVNVLKSILNSNVERLSNTIDKMRGNSKSVNDIKSVAKDLNRVIHTGRRFYTLLDVAYENEEANKEIIRVLKDNGAKTYKQLTQLKPPLISGVKRNISTGIRSTKGGRSDGRSRRTTRRKRQ